MISCEQHDYIEIACLYRIKVALQLLSGDTLEGVATDTKNDETRQECIELTQGTTKVLVPIHSIVQMEALTENTHFSTLRFQQN